MHSNQPADIRRGTRNLFLALAVWGVAVALAAQAGVYRAIYPPLIGPIVAAGILIPAATYAAADGFRGYIEAIGLRPLTLFHVWRIPAALLFFWYGAHDLLPPVFVRNAGWGDLLAGILAVVVILLPESRNRYLAFHLFGFADFVVAVGTGLTFTLLADPRMDGIRTLPLALIPLYGVGISGASHLMAFDLLRRGKGLRGERELLHA